jgi:hypothetical protein
VSFDIRQLRYAVAAADHGSFYRAARALEVEQSTLSRAILKLERSIGMPILRCRCPLPCFQRSGAFAIHSDDSGRGPTASERCTSVLDRDLRYNDR